MKSFSLKAVLYRIFESSTVFEWQQRLCNNYSSIFTEFGSVFKIKNQRILDIGTSTGLCAERVLARQEHQYTGIDINQNYVEAAARRFSSGHFYTMDARKLLFPDGSFDLAMFIGVIHHMDDKLVRECLGEIARVLSPNGRVIVAEPVFTPGKWLSTVLLKMDRGDYIRNKDSYQSLFNGFSVERQRFFRFSAHRFCSFILKPSVSL